MPEPSLKRTSEILRVIFQVLWPKSDGMPVRELLEAIPAHLKLSEAETSLAPATSTPQYENIAREVTNVLVEAGWFIKTRDSWYISDDGRAVCRNLKSVEEFYKAALQVVEENKQLRADSLLTVENAEEKAWEQIWKYLNEMNPLEFKYLVADLFIAMNYHLDWVAPPGKNRGYIDLVAHPNPLGSAGPRIKVHAQHSGQAATMEGLRTFLEELTPHDLGVFVSSGGFTEQVLEAERSQEFRRIRLVSLEDFFEFWVMNYENLSQEAIERFPLKAIWFLAPIS
jgi:restriction system protein